MCFVPLLIGSFLLCTTGLWILTREQKRDENLVKTLKNTLTVMGYDIDVLYKVDQTACNYPARRNLRGLKQ